MAANLAASADTSLTTGQRTILTAVASGDLLLSIRCGRVRIVSCRAQAALRSSVRSLRAEWLKTRQKLSSGDGNEVPTLRLTHLGMNKTKSEYNNKKHKKEIQNFFVSTFRIW